MWIGQWFPALFIVSRRERERLIQIPLRISLPLGDMSPLTGLLSMLFNMVKFHTVMLNKVQGRGMFTFSKIYFELHLKPEQRVPVFYH